MDVRLLPRRTAVVALALLSLAAYAPSSALAQSDAALGCAYTVAPDTPGPVGHMNLLQVTVRECSYAWNTLEVRLRNGSSATFTEPPVGFSCDDTGFDVVCGRPAPNTAGADLGIRPQCPNSARLRLTLVVTDAEGNQHVGAPRSLPCTRPPVKVLAPPTRQSLASALRRGVITRFSCRVRCTADVALLADSVTERKIGTATLRRTRAGTTVARVRIKPAYRRRYRHSAVVTVSVTVTANTGERITLGHNVRLRR